MRLAEAKKSIASYLTGRPVTRQVLAEACETIRVDQEYARYLAEELGVRLGWSSACEIFLSRVAEFSEMSPQERGREAPELLSHAEMCQACRHAYWNLRPLWISEPATTLKERALATVRRLGEQIRLVIDQSGRLFEEGLGPPSMTRKFVAATAGPIGEPPTTSDPSSEAAVSGQAGWKEWLLKDEDAGCTWRLIISPLPSGEAGMVCTLEEQDQTGRAAIAESTRIEVREAASLALHLAGRLADFQTEPIFLPEGNWIIRLQSATQVGARRWDIPLQIRSGAVTESGDFYGEQG